MDNLKNILNKIAAKSGPPLLDCPMHSCCLPNGKCMYMDECSDHSPSWEQFQEICENASGILRPDSDCFDNPCEDYSSSICLNCLSRTCTRFDDLDESWEEAKRKCLESGGHVEVSPGSMTSCEERLDWWCHNSPNSEPGACCMIATQPAPAFYLGCTNVKNGQECDRIMYDSGGIITTEFFEGEKCGEVHCEMIDDEWNKKPGACCKTCYEYNEYGEQKITSKTCRMTKKHKCLGRNWIDENGQPGPYHPDFVHGKSHCVHSWGGDNTLCEEYIWEEGKPVKISRHCKDGIYTPEEDDDPYEDWHWHFDEYKHE